MKRLSLFCVVLGLAGMAQAITFDWSQAADVSLTRDAASGVYTAAALDHAPRGPLAPPPPPPATRRRRGGWGARPRRKRSARADTERQVVKPWLSPAVLRSRWA